MQSLWNDLEAAQCKNDLALRVYTSRLLGHNPALVLHGGGNTSVKITDTNLFGEQEEILYVKGSGWDLATIEAEGFAPVKMDVLLKLAEMDGLNDTVIVREQRAAMTNPNAPNPSVEAILHAVIPFKFVDHTHTDAFVTLTNTPDGENLIREVYGERVLIVPYVMPGFTLAQFTYEMTRDVDWAALDGIALLNHGLFTFADDARTSYEKMIQLVTEAEQFLEQQGAFQNVALAEGEPDVDFLELSRLRKAISDIAGKPMIARLEATAKARGFASLPNVDDVATRGLLTPDHVIRTKRLPVILGGELENELQAYTEAYRAYFERHTDGTLTMLDPAPRWAVWKGQGIVTFDDTVKAAGIVADIVDHTILAIQWAEAIAEWSVLREKDIFDIEYWELEQAKLKRNVSKPLFQGKVALVTGAASGIGRACAESLIEQGIAVAALDINPKITMLFDSPSTKGIVCDMTDTAAVDEAIHKTITWYGGLDMLVSNAGIFPASHSIEVMDEETWKNSLDLNLTSHQRLLQACIPYLKQGIDPAVVIIGSKNFPAPGPGAGAYSVAKAGVTQLARVAALELAGDGIRVNVVHPDAVFDTGIWTQEVLEKRAAHYGMTIDQYKTKNLLGVEISSRDVADVVTALLSPTFSRTTGAQFPIDGGNDRVI